MINGYNLIQKFEKQNRNTIWKQMESLGKKAEIYSDRQIGIMPYLEKNTFYIYNVCHSIVVAHQGRNLQTRNHSTMDSLFILPRTVIV